MAIKPKNPRIVKAKPKPRPTSTAKPAPKPKPKAKAAVTKSRGSKTAKQMGDMNEREGYNMYARSERSTSVTKENAARRAKSGPGGKKNIKVKKEVGYRYGDHPSGSGGPFTRTQSQYDVKDKRAGKYEGTPTYYDYQQKTSKRGTLSDKTNRRAGGNQNPSAYEKAIKSQAKGVANKPKGSIPAAKRAKMARSVKGRAGK